MCVRWSCTGVAVLLERGVTRGLDDQPRLHCFEVAALAPRRDAEGPCAVLEPRPGDRELLCRPPGAQLPRSPAPPVCLWGRMPNHGLGWRCLMSHHDHRKRLLKAARLGFENGWSAVDVHEMLTSMNTGAVLAREIVSEVFPPQSGIEQHTAQAAESQAAENVAPERQRCIDAVLPDAAGQEGLDSGNRAIPHEQDGSTNVGNETSPLGEAGEQRLIKSIAMRLLAGEPRESVEANLVAGGASVEAASRLVSAVDLAVYQTEIASGGQARLGSNAKSKAVLAATIAALISAGVWAWVASTEGREYGLLAWGLGGAVGVSCVLGNGGRYPGNGKFAAGIAACGIIVGKFGVSAFYLSRLGHPAGLSLFDVAADLTGVLDIVWIALAVGTAWRLAEPQRHNDW